MLVFLFASSSIADEVVTLSNGKTIVVHDNFTWSWREKSIDLLKIKPNRISLEKAANTVALESSTGTWTEVAGNKLDYAKKLRAKVFSIFSTLSILEK